MTDPTTQKHTPEPWHIFPKPWPPSIRTGKEGYEIAEARSPYTNPEYRVLDRANGNRIVACVNACQGLADPVREIGEAKMYEMENESLRRELAEVKEAVKHHQQEAGRFKRLYEFEQKTVKLEVEAHDASREAVRVLAEEVACVHRSWKGEHEDGGLVWFNADESEIEAYGKLADAVKDNPIASAAVRKAEGGKQ